MRYLLLSTPLALTVVLGVPHADAAVSLNDEAAVTDPFGQSKGLKLPVMRPRPSTASFG